jgi:3-phosphoshikimate 1-carboxyvinyltransferase
LPDALLDSVDGSELIIDHVDRHARERPDTPAVIEVGPGGARRSYTWAQLQAESERIAALLLELGVADGEPVAYQLPNLLEFTAITLGILRIGAICEPLMPIFRERELGFMLRQSEARVLFVLRSFRNRDHLAEALAVQPELPALTHVLALDEVAPAGSDPDAELEPAAEAAIAARRPQPEQTAKLLFTSGSTGEPKGVLHRHATQMRAAAAHIQHFGLTADDVIHIPAPMAHQTGFLYGMWMALQLGATQVVQPIWDGAVGFEAMQDTGVTFVQAATPFLADLVRIGRERGQKPGALRFFVAAGAAIPRELARDAREVLGGEVGGGWGSSETCMGTAFAPGDPPARAWSTDGRPMDHVKLRIVDDEGHEVPAGVEGHYELLTPNAFQGYLNRPDQTAEAFTADGWYRTGDLAHVDADGYLHMTGRVKDVINRGGEKIPVAEIEQLLYQHPAVRDVAIVAMPDPRLGERSCAFVVLEDGKPFDFATMIAYLDGAKVTKVYWPERLELIGELPRTPSGKIQKFVLRERAIELAQGKAVTT